MEKIDSKRNQEEINNGDFISAAQNVIGESIKSFSNNSSQVNNSRVSKTEYPTMRRHSQQSSPH